MKEELFNSHKFKAYLLDKPEKLSLSSGNKQNSRIITLFLKLIKIGHALLKNCFMFNQRTLRGKGGGGREKKRETIFERHRWYRHSEVNLRYSSGADRNSDHLISHSFGSFNSCLCLIQNNCSLFHQVTFYRFWCVFGILLVVTFRKNKYHCNVFCNYFKLE